jgi:hypothetical protein
MVIKHWYAAREIILGHENEETADAPNFFLWWMKIEEASDKPILHSTPVASVRKKDGQAHALQHVSGDTTQDHLAQTRVPVAAHDQKVSLLIGGL